MKKITNSTLYILLSLVFIISCKQEQKKIPTETELQFSETLMSNFTENEFLKEEDLFTSKYSKEAKRPYEVYEELGGSLYKQRKISEAILVFERSAEVYTGNEDIVSSLAVLYERNNNKPEAIRNLDLAMAIAKTKENGAEAFYRAELKRLKRRDARPGIDIMFDEDIYEFSEIDKELITKIILHSEKEVRVLLPTLPLDIRLIVSITDENVDQIGGVNGHTEKNSPAEVFVEVSSVFPGGVTKAIQTSLSALIFHEFHHLSRGWAIKDNKFGPGISIASINEGLAVVFSETYTGVKLPGNSFANGVEKWVEEIMLLPKNANYGTWMFKHPDGRTAIGYRAGNYLVRKAMAKSGKNIIDLSKLSPDEILVLAEYK